MLWRQRHCLEVVDEVIYFLTSSKTVVMSSHTQFSFRKVTAGVPQGSILLFLIYCNDLLDVVFRINTVPYVDDTSLFASNKDQKQLGNILGDKFGINLEGMVFSKWFQAKSI